MEWHIVKGVVSGFSRLDILRVFFSLISAIRNSGRCKGGFDEIVGIELIQDYVDISESRADFWAKQPQQPELL